jgi:hypothetical protein
MYDLISTYIANFVMWHVAKQCHTVVQLIFLAHVFDVNALVAITTCNSINNPLRLMSYSVHAYQSKSQRSDRAHKFQE